MTTGPFSKRKFFSYVLEAQIRYIGTSLRFKKIVEIDYWEFEGITNLTG